MKLNPYIYFEGNAEEALKFYAEVLNGEVLDIQRYGDSPVPCDDDYKQKVMHARLLFDGNLVMVSDGPKGSSMSTEGNIQMSLDVEEHGKIDEIFNKVAQGGRVTMPLQDTFWGARFGMLKDKFGVNWMFNHQTKPNTSEHSE